MKRLVTSDWQLCDNERDRYRTSFVVKEIPKLIDKYKVDQLIMLGDITEEKDKHPASLVNEIVGLFAFLSKKCRVIILQGNHDFLHKGYPYFQFLEHLKTISWIDNPSEVDNCLFLPHTRDYKKDWKDVDFNKDYDFVFAHNIFTGANANGQKLSGIPTNIFTNNSYVISGDVHEPQVIDEKVIYVGAPFLCDFSDDYQPRILVTDGLLIKSIKVGGPQKRVVELVWREQNDWNPVAFKHFAEKKDILKIKIHLEMEHIANWDQIRSSVVDLFKGAVINTVQPIVNYEQGERTKVVKSVKKSDLDYLAAFVKRVGADERTAQVGKDLLTD